MRLTVYLTTILGQKKEAFLVPYTHTQVGPSTNIPSLTDRLIYCGRFFMCTMPYLCCRCCYSTVIFAFLPIPYPRLTYHILINPFTYAIITGIQSSLARTGWRNASHLKWYNLDHTLSHPISFVNFHHLFHKVFCIHKFSPILSTLFSHPSHFLFFTF